jgi:hypothetical protein
MVRTAMVHLEAPGRAGRTLVLLPPTDFDPDPRFAEELLARLAAAPWLEPSRRRSSVVTELLPEPALLRVQPADPLPGPARERARDAPSATSSSSSVRSIRRRILDEAVVASVARAARRVRRAAAATSRAFARDVDRAVALLGGVRAGVDGAFGAVRIGIDDVTLTDRDGTVPITVARFGGVPIRVRLEVTGPAALTWTDGRVRELCSHRTPTARSRSRSAPADRPVPRHGARHGPDRRAAARDRDRRVRATAVAGPALALIAAPSSR